MRHQALLALMLFLPLLAWADAAQVEEDQNRRQFETWRQDPAHLQRLRRDAKAFFALSEEDRQRIARFDRELHQEDQAEQARLKGVMDRYNQWLARLPETDRENIKKAAETEKRLTVIGDLRDQEWMQQQSKVRRDKY